MQTHKVRNCLYLFHNMPSQSIYPHKNIFTLFILTVFFPIVKIFFDLLQNILFFIDFRRFLCYALPVSPLERKFCMHHKLKLIHGPNLNMLGIRQPEIYGSETLADIEAYVQGLAGARGFSVECFQSNSEGAIIDAIHACYGTCDGIILNAGAYTHYSYAIRDAISSVMLPCVEVHLSDIHSREPFRSVSVLEPVCVKQICGMGKAGYGVALEELLNHVR